MINFKSLIKHFPQSTWSLYWDNKWKKGVLKYKTTSGKPSVDVRTLLSTTCPGIKADGGRLSHLSNDDAALFCLRYVMKNVLYVSDKKKYGVPEKWQRPEETYKLQTGDCEDGALLLMKLMQHAGIPAWRRKVCCGWVKTSNNIKSGHAYVIYLADDFCWYCMDWCFFPLESVCAYGKQPHNARKDKYLDIWFCWNEKYSWIQHDTIINWRDWKT